MTERSSYTVELRPAAKRALRKITDQAAQRRITAVFVELSRDPRPDGVKALKGGEGLLRVRAGDYRIVYTVQDAALLVLVVTVGHRRQVYDRLR